MNSKTLIGVVVLGALASAFIFRDQIFAGETVARDPADVYRVKKGDLRIVVTESCTLQAKNSEVVRSEVEGRNTILWLIPEGSKVKKGEKICELDVSNLKDREETQAISVSRAKSALVTAQKNFEIQTNQNKSDIESANNKLIFSKMDLEKFTGVEKTEFQEEQMGESQQRIIQNETDIQLKEERWKQAQLKYDWTKKLHAKNYVPDRDLEADRISVLSAENDLKLARNRLKILKRYDLPKELRDLEAKVKEAAADLERTKLRCQAKIAQQQADVDTKKEQYGLEVAKLEKFRKQIEAGVLKAPADGLVVYANVGDRRRQEPISEGTDVRQGQAILTLPDTSEMIARTSIHEAQIGFLDDPNREYEATIKVDALPDHVFTGRVVRVGQTADTSRSWFNPEIKLYKCEIAIDGDLSLLKPNQNASVEIIADEVKNVLTVPIQAVRRDKRVLYVWKDTGGRPQPVPVERSLSNSKFVVITKGIEEGDAIYLSEPSGVARPDFKELNAKLEKVAEAKAKALKARRKPSRGRAVESSGTRKSGGLLDRARSRMGGARKGGGRPGEGSREGGNGRRLGGMSAMMAKWNEFYDAVKKAMPEYKEVLSDRRKRFGLLRDEAFKKKVEAHPTLGPKFKKLTEGMRSRMGGGRTSGGRPGMGGKRGSRRQGGERRDG